MFDKISGNIFPWSDIVVNILTNGYLASELRKKLGTCCPNIEGFYQGQKKIESFWNNMLYSFNYLCLF